MGKSYSRDQHNLKQLSGNQFALVSRAAIDDQIQFLSKRRNPRLKELLWHGISAAVIDTSGLDCRTFITFLRPTAQQSPSTQPPPGSLVLDESKLKSCIAETLYEPSAGLRMQPTSIDKIAERACARIRRFAVDGRVRFLPPDFCYYDVRRNWRKVEPHLSDRILNDRLMSDFNVYTVGSWGKKFQHGQYPNDDMRCEIWVEKIGKQPSAWRYTTQSRRAPFWRYTRLHACHWLVNFNLRLAKLVEPGREWRIIWSKRHSTVWDGNDMLFDLTYFGLSVDPNECFEAAFVQELPPGCFIDVWPPAAA